MWNFSGTSGDLAFIDNGQDMIDGSYGHDYLDVGFVIDIPASEFDYSPEMLITYNDGGEEIVYSGPSGPPIDYDARGIYEYTMDVPPEAFEASESDQGIIESGDDFNPPEGFDDMDLLNRGYDEDGNPTSATSEVRGDDQGIVDVPASEFDYSPEMIITSTDGEESIIHSGPSGPPIDYDARGIYEYTIDVPPEAFEASESDQGIIEGEEDLNPPEGFDDMDLLNRDTGTIDPNGFVEEGIKDHIVDYNGIAGIHPDFSGDDFDSGFNVEVENAHNNGAGLAVLQVVNETEVGGNGIVEDSIEDNFVDYNGIAGIHPDFNAEYLDGGADIDLLNLLVDEALVEEQMASDDAEAQSDIILTQPTETADETVFLEVDDDEPIEVVAVNRDDTSSDDDDASQDSSADVANEEAEPEASGYSTAGEDELVDFATVEPSELAESNEDQTIIEDEDDLNPPEGFDDMDLLNRGYDEDGNPTVSTNEVTEEDSGIIEDEDDLNPPEGFDGAFNIDVVEVPASDVEPEIIKEIVETGSALISEASDTETIETNNGPETITLSSETIVGTDDGDKLVGTRDDDSLSGGEGNDILVGRRGDDTLDGGEGNDKLLGGRGEDVLIGGEGDDKLFGGRGDDTLAGGAGDDKLSGGRGDDNLGGGDGDDRLMGGKGNDALFGEAGNDRLYGHKGDDILSAGDGDDSLHGGRGDDALESGAGDDSLFGGRGEDLFIVGDEGTDTIGDFVVGQDSVQLSDAFENALNEAGLTIEDVVSTNDAGNLVLSIGGQTVIVEGVSIDDLEDEAAQSEDAVSWLDIFFA